MSGSWEKVLGFPNVGVNDNFFDLGGHSILAVRLLAEVEKVVGRKIPLTSLFRGSTVASLAKLLREGSESDPEPLVAEFQSGKGGFAADFRRGCAWSAGLRVCQALAPLLVWVKLSTSCRRKRR